MKKETTYQRYKRENRELKLLVDKDLQLFMLGQKDFHNRLMFLKKMALLYKKEQRDKLNNEISD